MKYRKRRLALWSVLLLCLVFVVLVRLLLIDPVNAENFNKLRDGMSRAEVDDLLGAPAETRKLEKGHQAVWKGRRLAIHLRFDHTDCITDGEGEVLFAAPTGVLETIRTFLGL